MHGHKPKFSDSDRPDGDLSRDVPSFISCLYELSSLKSALNSILSFTFCSLLYLTDSSLSINVTFSFPLSLTSLCVEWLCWLSEKAVPLSPSLPLCLCACCLIKCNKRDCDARHPHPPPILCSYSHHPSSPWPLSPPPPPSGPERMLNLHLLQTNHVPSFQHTLLPSPNMRI